MTDIDFSLATILLELINKEGGIKFYTEMTNHVKYELKKDFTDQEIEEMTKKDVMILGSRYNPITIGECIIFVKKLKKRVNKTVFQERATYHFEGFHQKNNTRHYMIYWGT